MIHLCQWPEKGIGTSLAHRCVFSESLPRQHDLTGRDGTDFLRPDVRDQIPMASFSCAGGPFCGIRLSRHSELFSLDIVLGLPWPSVVNLPANLDALVVHLQGMEESKEHVPFWAMTNSGYLHRCPENYFLNCRSVLSS
jgi:hypothetical protein